MIYDKIKNIRKYVQLFPELIAYLEKQDIHQLSLGKTHISESLFVIVNEYETSESDKNILENHKEFIDFQIMLAGKEMVAIALDAGAVVKAYDGINDYELVEANPSFLPFGVDEFMVFFPRDYHRPGIAVGHCDKVKKIVFKVKI